MGKTHVEWADIRADPARLERKRAQRRASYKRVREKLFKNPEEWYTFPMMIEHDLDLLRTWIARREREFAEGVRRCSATHLSNAKRKLARLESR